MKGFIYILTNRSLSSLKIGKTKADPSNREKELSSHTGIPTPFQLVWYALVEDYAKAELIIHKHFDQVRVNPRREFFEVNASTVVSAVEHELNIKILFEEWTYPKRKWTYEAASEYPECERWKHFEPPSEVPFYTCPHCEKSAVGVLITKARHIDVEGLSEEISVWANSVGSLVSVYPEIDPSLCLPIAREGPFYCWSCMADKHEDYFLEQLDSDLPVITGALSFGPHSKS